MVKRRTLNLGGYNPKKDHCQRPRMKLRSQAGPLPQAFLPQVPGVILLRGLGRLPQRTSVLLSGEAAGRRDRSVLLTQIGGRIDRANHDDHSRAPKAPGGLLEARLADNIPRGTNKGPLPTRAKYLLAPAGRVQPSLGGQGLR